MDPALWLALKQEINFISRYRRSIDREIRLALITTKCSELPYELKKFWASWCATQQCWASWCENKYCFQCSNCVRNAWLQKLLIETIWTPEFRLARSRCRHEKHFQNVSPYRIISVSETYSTLSDMMLHENFPPHCSGCRPLAQVLFFLQNSPFFPYHERFSILKFLKPKQKTLNLKP